MICHVLLKILMEKKKLLWLPAITQIKKDLSLKLEKWCSKVLKPPLVLADLSFWIKRGNLKGNSDYNIFYILGNENFSSIQKKNY